MTTHSTAPGTRQVIPVSGMTCASCERRIDKAMSKVPGVASAHSSATLGQVEIVWAGRPNEAAAHTAIVGLGYTIGRPQWVTDDRHIWDTFIASLVVVGALYAVLHYSGALNISTGSSQLATGGLVVVLLLGLAAGVSTCMAMTGGLVLAVSAAHTEQLARTGATNPSVTQRLRPIITFLAGRIVGFAILGAVLGAIGGSFTIPTQVTALMIAVVAVVMTILGLRLTELSPRIAGWTPRLPAGLARTLRLDDRATSSYSTTRTALLGVATFFLPCGFTQAAQLFALSTGSPSRAGAIMATFALGTTPGLLVLGGLPEFLPTKYRTTMLRGLGVLVLGFALINLSAAFHLSGINFGGGVPVGSGPTSNVTVTSAVQTVAMTQNGYGYSPSTSVVYAGTPIRWNINSTDPQTCAAFLRVPGLNMSVALNPGINSYDIPAQSAGTIHFTCSMGMYSGQIVVVPRPAAAAK